jgi:methionyl-tRNA synthetase
MKVTLSNVFKLFFHDNYMLDYLGISGELGINPWLLLVIAVWSLAWKLGALWKSARKGSIIWFIVIGLVNTVGILEILYIFIFSKLEFGKKPKKKSKKK